MGIMSGRRQREAKKLYAKKLAERAALLAAEQEIKNLVEPKEVPAEVHIETGESFPVPEVKEAPVEEVIEKPKRQRGKKVD